MESYLMGAETALFERNDAVLPSTVDQVDRV